MSALSSANAGAKKGAEPPPLYVGVDVAERYPERWRRHLRPGEGGEELELNFNSNDKGIQTAGTLELAQLLSSGSVPSLTSLSMRYNNIGDNGAQALAAAVRSNTRLTRFTLTDDSLETAGCAAMATVLEGNVSLTYLSLFFIGNSEQQPRGPEILARSLGRHPALLTLNLDSNSIGEHESLALADALRANTVLTDLSIRRNQIGAVGARAMSAALRSNKQSALRTLLLGQNGVGDDGAAAMAEVLRENRTLCRLEMWKNGLSGRGVAQLAQAIRANQASSLEDLNLDYNDLGDDGGRAIAELLKSGPLLSLAMGNCSIGRKGIQAISESLSSQSPTVKLRSLWVFANAFGDEGAALLADMLRTNRSLTAVNLQENRIGDVGATALAAALSVNNTLSAVDLFGNAIQDAGAAALSGALLENSTLLHLALSGNRFSSSGAKPLLEAMKQNRTLTDLLLPRIVSDSRMSADPLQELFKVNTTLLRVGTLSFPLIEAQFQRNQAIYKMLNLPVPSQEPRRKSKPPDKLVGRVAFVGSVQELPPAVPQWEQLTGLFEQYPELIGFSFHRARISPATLGHLFQHWKRHDGLRALYLGGNAFEEMPPALSLLAHQLTTVDLSYNQLSDLEPLCELTSLETLLLQHNKIRSIPAKFSKLVQLKRLNLAYNKCHDVSALHACQQLVELDISNNMLRTPPWFLAVLRYLEHVNLHNNAALPPEMLQLASTKGWQGVLGYLREGLLQGTVPSSKVKLITLGHGAVGKSTLLDAVTQKLTRTEKIGRFFGRKYLVSKRSMMDRTTWVDMRAKWVIRSKGTKVSFKVMDFPGQPEYYATNSMFLSGLDYAILLVVIRLVPIEAPGPRRSATELTREQLPHNETQLKLWLRAIDASAAQQPQQSSTASSESKAAPPSRQPSETNATGRNQKRHVLIVGTCADQADPAVYQPWLLRIEQSVRQEFPDIHLLGARAVWAEDRSDGKVQELRQLVKQTGVDLVKLRGSTPASLVKIQERLTHEYCKLRLVSLQSMQDWLGKFLGREEQRISAALQYLELNGDIMVCGNKVVVDPYWMAKVIFYVVTPEGLHGIPSVPEYPHLIEEADMKRSLAKVVAAIAGTSTTHGRGLHPFEVAATEAKSAERDIESDTPSLITGDSKQLLSVLVSLDVMYPTSQFDALRTQYFIPSRLARDEDNVVWNVAANNDLQLLAFRFQPTSALDLIPHAFLGRLLFSFYSIPLLQGQSRFYVTRTKFSLTLPSGSRLLFTFDDGRRFFDFVAACNPASATKDLLLALRVVDELLVTVFPNTAQLPSYSMSATCSSCLRANDEKGPRCPRLELNVAALLRVGSEALTRLVTVPYSDPLCPYSRAPRGVDGAPLSKNEKEETKMEIQPATFKRTRLPAQEAEQQLTLPKNARYSELPSGQASQLKRPLSTSAHVYDTWVDLDATAPSPTTTHTEAMYHSFDGPLELAKSLEEAEADVPLKAPTTATATAAVQDSPWPLAGSFFPIHMNALSNISYLAEGNFGFVFRAKWKGHDVVVKVSKTAADISSFEEFQTYMLLEPHPNVVPLLGLCPRFHFVMADGRTVDGKVCLVLPFADGGGSLEQLLHGSSPHMNLALTTNTAIAICRDIALGLAHLHHSDILHRDLASRNVLRFADGRVCITDFGMSRAVKNYKFDRNEVVPLRTIAPETVTSGSHAQSSDVWMFGLTLFEVLSRGLRPYPSISDDRSVVVALRDGAIDLELHRVVPELAPEPVRKVLQQCLDMNPGNRPTAAEAAIQLDDTLQAL